MLSFIFFYFLVHDMEKKKKFFIYETSTQVLSKMTGIFKNNFAIILYL